MAKLKDLIKLDDQQDIIKIRGIELPIAFDMRTFDYVEEAYGSSYTIFEKDMNKMLSSKNVKVSSNVFKIMRTLIYAMVRAGGTECTPDELAKAIPLTEMPSVFESVLGVFQGQYFQPSDGEKIKQTKK